MTPALIALALMITPPPERPPLRLWALELAVTEDGRTFVPVEVSRHPSRPECRAEARRWFALLEPTRGLDPVSGLRVTAWRCHLPGGRTA